VINPPPIYINATQEQKILSLDKVSSLWTLFMNYKILKDYLTSGKINNYNKQTVITLQIATFATIGTKTSVLLLIDK
jgi:hypothetical protein